MNFPQAYTRALLVADWLVLLHSDWLIWFRVFRENQSYEFSLKYMENRMFYYKLDILGILKSSDEMIWSVLSCWSCVVCFLIPKLCVAYTSIARQSNVYLATLNPRHLSGFH